MPSGRPIRNSGCGVSPPYSRPMATELVARTARRPSGCARTRGPRGRRSRTPRTGGRARGTPAGGRGPRSRARRRSDRGVPRRRPSSSAWSSRSPMVGRPRRPTVAASGSARPRPSPRAARIRSPIRGSAAQRAWSASTAPAIARRTAPEARPPRSRCRVMSSAGVTSNGGFERGRPVRRDRHAADLEDLVGGALLDLDGGTVGGRRIERRHRRADEERHAVPGGEHAPADTSRACSPCRRSAATRSAPTRITSTSPAAMSVAGGRRPGSSVCGHARLLQLPGREAGALEVRAASRRPRRGARRPA